MTFPKLLRKCSLAFLCLGACLLTFFLLQVPAWAFYPADNFAVNGAAAAVKILACTGLGASFARKAEIRPAQSGVSKYVIGGLLLLAVLVAYYLTPSLYWNVCNQFSALTADPAVSTPSVGSYLWAWCTSDFAAFSSVAAYVGCGLGYFFVKGRRVQAAYAAQNIG